MPAPKDTAQAYTNYLLLVGRIATHYAAFEHVVNETIWKLANLDDRIGACLTSEIISYRPRFRILIALMHERGFTKQEIDKIDKLSKEAGTTTQFRNKYVHSPFEFAIKDGAIVPMIRHIKIETKLKSGLTNYDFKEMAATSEKCLALTRAAMEIKELIEHRIAQH